MNKEIGWIDLEVANIELRESNIGRLIRLTFESYDGVKRQQFFSGVGERSPLYKELINAVFAVAEINTWGLETEDIWDVGLLMFGRKLRGLLMRSDTDTISHGFWFKHYEPLKMEAIK
jgi:hypothetical protein